MNEIKRQLDQKMGDTKNRANHLIAKINKEKRPSNRNRKSPSSIPYFLTLGSFAVLMALFFLMNPFDLFQENTSDDPTLVAVDLNSYFRKSGDVAYYEGIGSDIASYKVVTLWLSEHYVQHLITNDGAVVQRIFRITEDEIQLVYNKEINEPPMSFDSDELDQLPIIDVLLKAPLEDGNSFDGKAVSFPVTVDTPIGSFENAVKISEQMEDGVNDVFYVPNEGIVKTVYSFEDGNEVTSVLNSVVNDDVQTLKSYFRKSGDVAYYEGTGNEYASFKLETTWLADDYVQTVIDNGGGITQEIYRITANEIQLIYNEMIESAPEQFELNDLEKLPVISVILQGPLEDGKTFNGKTISYPETVETPIGTFDIAVKVSEQYDGGMNHFYYVPNEGLVKRVASFNDGEEVISELISVENDNLQTLKSFFRQSDDVAYYEGSGGDTSNYNVETTWLADNYVQHIIEYEGTTMQHVYRITNNEIQNVYNDNYEQRPAHFELAALDQLPVISVLLKMPIENGESFEGKTISYPETVDTPIGSFDNAVKISVEDEFGVWHTYYAPNEGKVKEVYTFSDGGEGLVSELSSVGSSSNSTKYSDLPDSITAVNVKTNKNKKIILNEHPVLQILLGRVDSENFDSLSFTYVPYSAGNGSVEYGILKFGCSNDYCTLLLIKEEQGQSQSILVDYGDSPDSILISPDGKKAMIGLRIYWDSNIYRDRIVLIDLTTMSRIKPAESELFQDRPMEEFKWLNDNTIQITAADIKNYDYSNEALQEWLKLEDKAPLKELTITLQ